MKEKPFKYRLWREDRTVFFHIASQPESWRGNVRYRARNSRWVVRSMLAPQLQPYNIFLRGRFPEHDNRVVSIEYTNPQVAGLKLRKYQETLRKFWQAQAKQDRKD
jgi:hypothetical protein